MTPLLTRPEAYFLLTRCYGERPVDIPRIVVYNSDMSAIQKPSKKLTSFRFNPDADALLDALAQDMNLPRVYVVELLIKDRAKRRGLCLPPKESP